MSILGINGKLYRNTGTYASPTWVLVENVHDLTLNLSDGEADVTSRNGGGYKLSAQALREASIEFDMIYDPTDTDMTALLTAYLARTAVEMLVLDGLEATVGSQGLRASMAILSFNREENAEDVMRVSVSMKPTASANAPAWFVKA